MLPNEYNIPAAIEARAFRHRSEYAWQRHDLAPVLDYCVEASIAIVGGEAWIVRRVDECAPDQPTEFSHNLDVKLSRKGSVLARSKDYVIYGGFPSKDGRFAVFSWSSRERAPGESWQDYVEVTAQETLQVIERGDLESDVVPEYSRRVYYNLVFCTLAEAG
jgi:hypothetical protein